MKTTKAALSLSIVKKGGLGVVFYAFVLINDS